MKELCHRASSGFPWLPLTTFIGLLPLMFSHGAGADVMKRFAAPMATSFLLELTVYPAIFALWRRRVSRSNPAVQPTV